MHYSGSQIDRKRCPIDVERDLTLRSILASHLGAPLAALPGLGEVTLVTAELTDPWRVLRLLESQRPDFIFHFAAQAFNSHWGGSLMPCKLRLSTEHRARVQPALATPVVDSATG